MNEEPNNPTEPLTQIGKYQIIEHIATGGMGVVYKAHDSKLDRLVALKLLPADLAKQKTTLIRFEREAKAAARLEHENIVAIYDVDEEDGTHFIAFEFIEGDDLQDYINRKCKLDPEEAHAHMLAGIAEMMRGGAAMFGGGARGERTDAEGRYTLKELPAGQHRVRVTTSGRSMPITARPSRPGHFYGNAVRRNHTRSQR